MPYIQNSEADRQAMLARIGVESFNSLFDSIPAAYRIDRPLQLDAGLDEHALREHVGQLAAWNRPASERPCFLGAGVYDHTIPAVVDSVCSRSEFVTAYTPYQPEASQGTLQSIYEFQSMIAELTGMEVANASMYDGATAAAEAALMASSATRRKRVLVSAGCHPDTRRTLSTYLRHLDIELVEAPLRGGTTDWSGVDVSDAALVLVQQPNFLGLVEDLDAVSTLAHDAGAWAGASVNPVALGLLRSPGDFGFEVVVGDGQPLGVPMSLGGPSFGFFATTQAHVRRMPGRLVGMSEDRSGRRAYTLTFQTREQHIRREKATSNICTNNALVALRGAVHLAALGPVGLEEVASISRQRALALREALLGCEGFEDPFPEAAAMHEFPLRLDGGDEAVLQLKIALAQSDIAAIVPMSRYYDGMEGVFTLACTEKTSSEAIRRFLQVVEALPSREAAR